MLLLSCVGQDVTSNQKSTLSLQLLLLVYEALHFSLRKKGQLLNKCYMLIIDVTFLMKI